MLKTILVTILAVVSSNAMAEWVEVDGDDVMSLTIYADPSTIIKRGNMVIISVLYDYKTIQHDDKLPPFLSNIYQEEYDCNELRTKSITSSDFSKNMGTGVEKNTDDLINGEWSSIEPDSHGEALWEFACKKNRKHEHPTIFERIKKAVK
jgi:hypothetical protein